MSNKLSQRTPSKKVGSLTGIKAISFDLDDTLWPLMPTVMDAEKAQWQWLSSNYPHLAEHLTPQRADELREQLLQEGSAQLADVSWARQELLRRLAASAGLESPESEQLVTEAFKVFLQQRCAVLPFDDALQVLPRLAENFRLVAITNGNADVFSTALGELFEFSLSPTTMGVAKPDAVIFNEALEQLGLPAAQVLHVGDSVKHDVVGASAVGMRTALMLHNEVDSEANGHYQNTGKNAALFEDEEHGADAVVRSLHELELLLV